MVWADKWSVLGVAAVVWIIGILYAQSRVPTYRASVTLMLEPRVARPIPMQDGGYDSPYASLDYYGTQLEIIRSRDQAAKVVDRLNLASHPEFNTPHEPQLAGLSLNWRSWLPFLPEPEAVAELADPSAAAGAQDAQKREAVINKVAYDLKAEIVPRTQILRVSYTTYTPELASDVANAYADVYIEYGLESRLAATQKANRWLTERLADIRIKLEKAEQALQAFREQQQLVNVGGVRGLMSEDLLDSSKRLRDSQKTKTELASTYWKVQQAGDDILKLQEIGGLLSYPGLQEAKQNLLSAQEGIRQLEQRYGDRHPQMATARTRLEISEKSYRAQLQLAVQSVKTEYEIALQNEKALTAVVDSAKEQIRRMDRKDYELRVLEREVATNQQLYDLFLTRFKETDTSASFEAINARVVEPARAPDRPFYPNITQITQRSLLLGLFLGVALVLLRRNLDESIRSAEDLENFTGIPVVGIIPAISMDAKASLPLEFHANPRGPLAEGVRSVRASLQLTDVDKRFKRLVVTSAVPSEGKTSLAACLALSFTHTERTVLIEADLRAPSLRRVFQIPKAHPGVMEHLTGEKPLDECLYRHEASGLSILPVAMLPPNPAEVIQSAAFAGLLEVLGQRFERIVIDTPPVHAASDSMVLGSLANAVLFVVKAGETHRRTVTAALKQLQQAQAHVVGSVINHLDLRRQSYYYGGQYYAYKYKYGQSG
jgi:capsular exopolysaccharide synthesis family protein